MSIESDVLKELEAMGGDKIRLMAHYSAEMMKIQQVHGGNVSDIPANSDHEYHDYARKLRALHSLKGV